ncbi:MAG: hypothetical protein R6X16_04705 [Anaerolineae bacterium]
MRRVVIGFLLIVSLLLATAGSGVGLAEEPSPGVDVPITRVDGCMQDVAGFSLVCSANDVRLSRAMEPILISDPCDFPGDTVTFMATFETVLTAQARHDIGIYFATDGDPNGDGAVTGTCTSSTVPYAPNPPWLDLDGINDPYPGQNKASGVQDVCGDIDAAHSPLYPVITITAQCIDTNGNGWLNLPYCTSWRQPGANELCLGPEGAFPGAPSKCSCDTGFEVPVPVPAATIDVTKTANPTSVYEPGASVTFTVSIKNTGMDPANPVTITSLSDNVYGSLNSQGTCTVPQTIAAQATYTCSFSGAVSGNAGDLKTDTVTASGTDARDNPVSDTASATVTILDAMPEIRVSKSADPTSLNEPGGNVEFTVVVYNDSVELVTLDSLTDDVYGDLDGQGDCLTGGSIAAGESYSCAFTGPVSGGPGTYTDTVTATASDDEGNDVIETAQATVTIVDVAPTSRLDKSASPTSLNEPGGDVTFTVVVYNDSAEAVTLTSLVDDVYGDLNGQGDCLTEGEIAAGGSYSCSFVKSVTGEPGTHTDTITSLVTDDDGSTDEQDDDATVTIVDVMPAITVDKAASPTSVPEPGGMVTFTVTVTNTSVEPITLNTLTDTIHGDLAGKGTCVLPQDLVLGGSYSFSFSAMVSGDGGDTETDWAYGSATDNEGNTATDNDDATVTIADVLPAASLAKNVYEVVVRFEVVVTNDSVSSDPLTVDALEDDIYGDITTVHDDVLDTDCDTGGTIDPGESYTCYFTAVVRSAPQTDVVTADVSDDEDNVVTPKPSDDAWVDFGDPPSVEARNLARRLAV